MALIERNKARPLIALQLPEQAALPPATDFEDQDYDEDFGHEDDSMTGDEEF
jgi:hypothetical protein